ncbi:heat shock factor protein 3-like [Cavia porcellus]|uniref:heat shock factor protein 3-like n=1 Tax=Cavia porcellus TaxID=10141 RepID=UPI002FDF87DB
MNNIHNGQSFCIVNEQIFAKKVLPKYFKHNNIASFTRQLNIYGFRKVIGLENGKTDQKAPAMEFQHPLFKKGGANFLENIKRKVPSVKMEDMRTCSDELQRMMTEVQEMGDKQSNMDVSFSKLKKQYTTLWLEMKNLRQKYGEQQQLLTQILQFILCLMSENHMVNKSRKRSLPVISELEDSKCAPQYFHIPEERKEEMAIIKDGYAIIEDKYKSLLDSGLPTLRSEYKNLVSSVDQTNRDHRKDPNISSQEVPLSEDSALTDLDLVIPDLQDLMTMESFEQETEDMPLELESLLSQDIESMLTEDKSNVHCDTITNSDEMHYTNGELMELTSFLPKMNVNYTSDLLSEPACSKLPNLVTNEAESLLSVHVMTGTDSLPFLENEEEVISLLDANAKEDKQVVQSKKNTLFSSLDEMLMTDFGEELQDSSDLLLNAVKNPSNVLPDLRDHDYIALNISSQQYVANPIENVMPHLGMESSGECKLFPCFFPNSVTNLVEESIEIDPST